MRSDLEAPDHRDVLTGILFGTGALALIAATLNVVDPLLRDPDGQVFSISQLLDALKIFG
ncbi:MAG: hypothetical protein ABWX70_04695 [Hyphomicrobium sp.]